METSKHWRFRYHGPRKPVDDRGCDLCAAVATGKNPKSARPGAIGSADKTHGTHSGPDGCPVERICRDKAAGKAVHCPNHAGLDAVIAHHKAANPDHDAAGFDSFAGQVLDHLAALPPATGADVEVDGWGTHDPRYEDGTPDYSQPFSRFEMRVVLPRTAEEHDQPYQATAPAKRAEEAKKAAAVATA